MIEENLKIVNKKLKYFNYSVVDIKYDNVTLFSDNIKK
jgi:hypothetical protein